MYNANPNYEMDFMILKDVNEHMEGLFQRFSKLLPFRIDFAYRKDTPSFGHSCRHSMCIEMHRLLSETQTMLAGYYWVMEYCSAAKFFAPKRIKLCTAARERKTAFAHGAN